MSDLPLTTTSILVVDDEEANVDLLQQLLARAGYHHVTGLTDPRRVLPHFRERRPDLILLDLLMPHLDGYAVLEQLRPEIGEDTYLPVVVLTADITPAAKQRALTLGANDFLTKPFDHVELLLRIRNLLETRSLHLRLSQQNALLERLYEQTREAVRARDESLSAITHDLGQPLTTIRVAAQMLKRQSGAGETLAEELAGIDDATTHMWSMLGELMDVVRLDAGRALDLHWEPVDLVALARQEAAAAARAAGSHQITVEASESELTIELDAARIRRVLANLLSNAVKYSPAGGPITVRVFREARGEGAGQAVVQVQDAGLGIPAADLPHIFERFHRAANVTGRIAGTGIGLATSRRIVEEHGGTLAAESTEGIGSTFTLRLPVE